MAETKPNLKVTRKKKSEKRKRNPIIPVRVTSEEKEKIIEQALKCSKAPSTYLRELGLGKNIKTTFDSQVVLVYFFTTLNPK